MPRHERHLIEDADVVVDEREAARRRLRARRDFLSNIVAYVVINAALVVIWATSGGDTLARLGDRTLGRGLTASRLEQLLVPPMTEADIDAEMRRHHQDDV